MSCRGARGRRWHARCKSLHQKGRNRAGPEGRQLADAKRICADRADLPRPTSASLNKNNNDTPPQSSKRPRALSHNRALFFGAYRLAGAAGKSRAFCRRQRRAHPQKRRRRILPNKKGSPKGLPLSARRTLLGMPGGEPGAARVSPRVLTALGVPAIQASHAAVHHHDGGGAALGAQLRAVREV
jgi:hypothetical protein